MANISKKCSHTITGDDILYINLKTVQRKQHHEAHCHQQHPGHQATFECFGCTKEFTSASARVNHLEDGTCESTADHEWVTALATCSGHLRAYVYRWRDEPYKFACSHCDAKFVTFSSLIQHAESDNCDESLQEQSALGRFMNTLKCQFWDKTIVFRYNLDSFKVPEPWW